MNGLTEKLLTALVALPAENVAARGEHLARAVWSRVPKDRRSAATGTAGTLTAPDRVGDTRPVEGAAFENTLRFAEEQFRAEPNTAAERACIAAPVLAALALAHARGKQCAALFRAVGLGAEAYVRLAGGLGHGTRPRGFDARVIAATLASIVACSAIEGLSSDQAAQALGLGSSAVTGVTVGYVPLQCATAARDGVVMALLMSCGFRGPPDPLACRWGVFEVFGDPKDAASITTQTDAVRAAGEIERLFGASSAATGARGADPVARFLAGIS